MAAIKVQPSRFALLNVEDDDSDDNLKKRTNSTKNNQSQKSAGKKKKKQQHTSQNNVNELKHHAFGLPLKHTSGTDQRPENGKHSNASKAQWDEWQKMDTEYTSETFEKDLQQALLLSKVEMEQQKQVSLMDQSSVNDTKRAGDKKENKKKKKKEKPVTVSLDEFNRQSEENKSNGDVLNVISIPPTKVPSSEADKKFFDSVDDDASRILRQEKLQDEYKKQYAAESVMTAKYHDQIRKLEKEVEFLHATVKKQEEELQQVKKRNKQLCVILAQGEMQDKADVLMQVDQLTGVKDELTEQVSELTAELEKERSKVHALKSELDRLKMSEVTTELEKERSKVHVLKSELDKHKGNKHK